MPNSIDERIVQMKFDNSQFESGVSTTLGTLDKLKSATELKGSTSGLDALGSAAETIQSKFSVMGTVIDQTLRNITNQVEAVATKMASAITVDPIKDGFAEYETQIGAVQTILANTSSKGTTLDEVNDALDTLNTYADKTIYNFTEMTRNIGTFTAAGVDLQTSVDSIQGIANLAAVSGSTSQQASTAMYQLSQALASGTVKLMDWNSVVNAGMGGAVFQEALIRTSEHLQTGAKAAIEAEGSFRDSLTTGWLTTDVLTETLNQFALAVDTEEEYNAAIKSLVEQGYTQEEAKAIADMAKTAGDAATKVKTFSQLMDTLKEALGSGWTQSWETIIGDFEEAKELWTEVSDIFSNAINKMSESRNAMLQEWKDSGGRTAILHSIENTFYNLLSIIQPIREAFREIFPATTGKQLADISKAIETFTEKFYLAKDSAVGLKSTFKGLFAVVDIILQAFKGVTSAILPVTGGLGTLVLTIFNITGAIGQGIVAVDRFVKEFNVFGTLAKAVVGFFNPLLTALKSFEQLLFLITNQGLKSIKLSLLNLDGTIKEIFNADIPLLDKLKQLKDVIVNSLIPSLSGVFSTRAFMNSLANTGLLHIGETLTETIVGSLANGLASIKSALTDMFGSAVTVPIAVATTLFSALGSVMGGVKDAFSTTTVTVTKALDVFEILGSIKIDLPIKASAVDKLQTSFTNLLPATESVSDKFGKIGSVFSKVTGTIINFVSKGINFLFESLGGVGGTGLLGLLNGGLLITALLQVKSLLKSLSGIFDGAKGLVDGLSEIKDAIIDTFGAIQSEIKAKALKSIAISIGVLAASLFVLSRLSGTQLAASLGGLAGLMAEIGVLFLAVNKISIDKAKMAVVSSSMIGTAAALAILSVAMNKMAKLTWGEIGRGLTATLTLMTGLTAASIILAKFAPKMATGASGMVLMAVAIGILTSAVEKMGGIDTKTLLKDILAMGAIFAMLALFTKYGDMGKTSASMGIGFVALSLSLKKIADVVNTFGNMDAKVIKQGMIALGVALTALALAMKQMPGNLPAIGAGLILVGAGLKIVSSVIKSMGNLTDVEVFKGLATLGTSLVMLSVGLKKMNGNASGAASMLIVAPALVVLAGALKILGSLSLGQIIKSIIALGGALSILSVALIMMEDEISGAAALIAVAAGLALLTPQLVILGSLPLGTIIKSLISLAGIFAVIGIAGTVLAPVAPVLISLSGALALLGLAVVGVGAGLMAAGIGLTTIAAAGSAAGMALTALFTSLIATVPLIITLLTQIISGILSAITTLAPKIGAAIVAVASTILTMLTTLVPQLVETVASIIVQVLQVLGTYIPQFISAATDFVVAFITGIAQNMGKIVQAAMELAISFINGLADGLRNNGDDLMYACENLGSSLIEFIGKWVPRIIEKGIELVINLAKGIWAGAPEIITNIGEAITDTIDYLGDRVQEWFDAGINYVRGFIDGIKEGAKELAGPLADFASAAVGSVENYLEINSPSKVTEKDGQYFAEGYGKGIEESTDEVVDNATYMADASVTAVSNTVADGLNDVVNTVKEHGESYYRYMSEYGDISEETSERISSVMDSTTGSTEANESAIEENTTAVKENTTAKESQAKATEKSAKELAEEQKILQKFAKYSVPSINATKTALDSMFGTVEDGSHLQVAQDAVLALAEQIYASSLEASDDISEVGETTEEVSESSQDHIQKIMEAFNEQFETYRDNIKDSIDLFEQFDAQLDSTKTGDEILANANSQIEGYTRLAQKYMLLANRGVGQSVLADLEEEGASALPKINSMLKMSDSQLREYLDDLEKIDTFSSAIAGQMMAAQAMSNMTSTWRKQAATQSGITDKMRKDYANYINQVNILNQKSAENTNLVFEETLDETHAGVVKVLDESGTVIKEQTIDVQAAIAQLATDAQEAGIDVDEMMTKLGNTAATEATAALQLVDAYTKAGQTVIQYQEYMSSMKDTVKETIESQLGLFDELELKTETTSKEVLEGLQSQITGMQKWAAEFQSVAARGLNDEILSQLAELGPEGYDSLHAFYTMSDAELTQANALYAQKLQITDAVSAQIGQSYAAAAVGGMQAYTNALSVYLGTDPTYQAAMQSLSTNAQTVLQSTMATVGQETAAKLTSVMAGSITDGSSEVSTAASTTAIQAGDAAKAAISQKSGELKTEATNAGAGATVGFGSNVNTTTGSKQTSWYIDGIINCFGARAQAVYNAAYAVGEAADAGTHDGMGNGSPSWKGAQQAMWYLVGVANGLEKMTGDAESAAYGSGSLIAEALAEAMAAADEIDTDITMHPTIAPIMDLTDAQNGANQLASMLNNSYGLNLNPNLGHITTDAERMNSLMGGLNGSNSMTYGDTNLYIYGSQGQNVKELADIVIGRLNNEYARRKAAWT